MNCTRVRTAFFPPLEWYVSAVQSSVYHMIFWHRFTFEVGRSAYTLYDTLHVRRCKISIRRCPAHKIIVFTRVRRQMKHGHVDLILFIQASDDKRNLLFISWWSYILPGVIRIYVNQNMRMLYIHLNTYNEFGEIYP